MAVFGDYFQIMWFLGCAPAMSCCESVYIIKMVAMNMIRICNAYGVELVIRDSIVHFDWLR